MKTDKTHFKKIYRDFNRPEFIHPDPLEFVWRYKSSADPPEYYEEMWTNMKKGVPWTGRNINKKKEEALCAVQANISPLKNSAWIMTTYVTIQEDVSALADVEEQLRQSQKMEAVTRALAQGERYE